MSNWNSFPHDASDYLFEGDSLAEHWDRLHAGDREPYPDDTRLQDAWRAFHRGDFGAAVNLADDIGLAAHAVANKATGIYATYLETKEALRQSLFEAAAERAEAAIEAFPDDPNAHYFHAFNLGRYMTGLLPETIAANLKVFVPGRPLDDYGHAVIRYQNGALGTVTASQMETYLREGPFPPGTMQPKIEAALQFVRQSGQDAVITSLDAIEDAVRGCAGTRITVAINSWVRERSATPNGQAH